MATVYVTIKIMPDSPEADLEKITEEAKLIISEYAGNVMESKEEPVAFGLKAILITFSRDEDKGSTDDIEEALSELDHVTSVAVADVRRGIG